MDRRQQRALRGAGASALAVFVAALFHAAGGGTQPTALALVVSFVLAAPACVLLAGRRASLWRLAASVALSQFAFHFLFGLGQPSDVRFGGDTAMAGMPGMHLTVSGGSAAAATTSMWLGHVMAALVTIVAIRHGERVIERMLALATRFLVTALALISAPSIERPHAPGAATLTPPVLFPQFLVGTTRHRGPPVRFAL
jgi:hypothetical protein